MLGGRTRRSAPTRAGSLAAVSVEDAAADVTDAILAVEVVDGENTAAPKLHRRRVAEVLVQAIIPDNDLAVHVPRLALVFTQYGPDPEGLTTIAVRAEYAPVV